MALSSKQQMILGGIGVGVIAGVVIGGIGGYFGLPAGMQGALTGGLVVVGLQLHAEERHGVGGRKPEVAASRRSLPACP